ncbi:hypothetical protein LCGC14_1636150 [marine sediment metagenome]|uniref:Uncharacterized protein n=1 Tax=marine sediment metagenome TaxID=412755 RepID=A0A0F9L0L7_9ZZZZ
MTDDGTFAGRTIRAESPDAVALLDSVEWVEIQHDEPVPDGELYATHLGTLAIPGIGNLRVYQLNNGQRVIDADDVASMFNLDTGEA